MRKELLAKFLGLNEKSLITSLYDEERFYLNENADNEEEYVVLTNEEADEWFNDMELELFNDIGFDMFTPEAKKYILNNFFDWDGVVKYIKENDGRGSMIASYDGIENEYNGYYIYRMN